MCTAQMIFFAYMYEFILNAIFFALTTLPAKRHASLIYLELRYGL